MAHLSLSGRGYERALLIRARLSQHRDFALATFTWRLTRIPLMVSIVSVLFVSFCAATTSGDRNSASTEWQRRTMYPALMRTIDLSASAPDPLRALALIRVAKILGNREPEWKKELLEDAFAAASNSTLASPVSYVTGPEGPFSELLPRIRRAIEINSGLDRLSLQTRIVREMLKGDKTEARRLFEEISLPDGAPLKCTDSLIPNVESYYDTASLVSLGSFALQRRDRMQREFLRRVLESLFQPTAVGPAAKMLMEQHLLTADLNYVVNIYSDRLTGISGDCRSFFADLDQTSNRVIKLVDSLPPPAAVGLLRSWHLYLVSNLSGIRCRETVDPSYIYNKWAAEAVKAFNVRARQLGTVDQIEEEQIKPKSVEPEVLEQGDGMSQEEKVLSKKGFALMLANSNRLSRKDDAQLNGELDDYVNSVEDLRASGQSEADLLWEKCKLLSSAVVAASDSSERERILELYIQHLKLRNADPEVLPAWYSSVTELLQLMHSFHSDEHTLPTALQESGDPLLSLVGDLYKMDVSLSTSNSQQ